MPISTPTTLDDAWGSNLNTSSFTSGSVSPTGNALVIACFGVRQGADRSFSGASSTFSTGGWTTLLDPTPVGSNLVNMGIAWAIADASPGSGTVTLTWGGNVIGNAILVEIASGFDLTTPFAQSATYTSASSETTPTSDLSGAPDSGSMLISVCCGGPNNTTIAAESGWTELTENGGANTPTNFQYRTGTTATSFGCTFGAAQDAGISMGAAEVQEPAGTTVTGSGAPAAGDADAGGTAERELPGSGTPAAQAADADGTAERVLTCSGTLVSAESSVDGTAALQLKVELTAATGRELRDEDGALVASLANIAYEWYDKDTDTEGNPDFSGTLSTNGSGEATIQLPGTALTAGQYGLLVLEHPSDNTIRGIYRIQVT